MGRAERLDKHEHKQEHEDHVSQLSVLTKTRFALLSVHFSLKIAQISIVKVRSHINRIFFTEPFGKPIADCMPLQSLVITSGNWHNFGSPLTVGFIRLTRCSRNRSVSGR